VVGTHFAKLNTRSLAKKRHAMLGLGEGRQGDKGVTMIELAVVMAIIAIIGLFMSPALGEWTAGFRVRGASKDLADALQLARIKAISTGNQYRVRLNINTGSSTETFVLQENDPVAGWINEGAPKNLPTGVNIDRIDPGSITGGNIDRTFNPNGTATGWAGSTSIIYVENQRNDQYRVVISQTGMVRLSEGW
jgi:prepilin-type N-terminal cleavage/methylation domain-containing protein